MATISKKPKTWLPYRVTGSGKTKGIVTTNDLVDDLVSSDEQHKLIQNGEQVTVLAFTNVELLARALQVMCYTVLDDKGDAVEIKIAVNGKGESSGKQLWRRVLKEIEDFYKLWKGEIKKLPQSEFQNYDDLSWNQVIDHIQSFEMNQYVPHISLVSKYKEETITHVRKFEEKIIKRNHDNSSANVILSTIHAAKGMEWDNVQLLDTSLVNLRAFKDIGNNTNVFCKANAKISMEFAFKNYGDDLNLWYVALTRAKKKLGIPSKFSSLIEAFGLLKAYNKIKLKNDKIAMSHFQGKSNILEQDGLKFGDDKDGKSFGHVECLALYNDLVLKWWKEMTEDQKSFFRRSNFFIKN